VSGQGVKSLGREVVKSATGVIIGLHGLEMGHSGTSAEDMRLSIRIEKKGRCVVRGLLERAVILACVLAVCAGLGGCGMTKGPGNAAPAPGTRAAGQEEKAFEAIAYPRYNLATKRMSLRARAVVANQQLAPGGQREFLFGELWRFEESTGRWEQVTWGDPAREPVRLVIQREWRQVGGRIVELPESDRILVDLADQIGLYWVKCTEGGKQCAEFGYCGPVGPNDVMIAPAPAGMVIANIPGENSAKVTYVPDPLVHCVSR
jgi:hypothetical protein